MKKINETQSLLELIDRPGFTAENGVIRYANTPARERQLIPGTKLEEILQTGTEVLSDFHEGSLYLTVSCAGVPWGATVTPMENALLFVLDQDNSTAALQAMSLAAIHLRRPLSEIMAAAENMSGEAQNSQCAARINQSSHSLLRMIRNMEDTSRYMSSSCPMQLHSIGDVLTEVVQCADYLAQQAEKNIVFHALPETVYAMAEPERLKRALYNMISNAMRATPKGGTIEVKLTKKEKMLYCSVMDDGPGIAAELQGNLFRAFTREPALHDGYHGLGLGMSVIRAAAASHHGTVLVDFPEKRGTRVTITIPIRNCEDNTVRTPILRMDSFGGFDQGLVELADVLPLSAFQK